MPPSSSSSLRACARVTLGIPLVVLICLLLLTACGGTSSTGTSSTGGTSAPAPTVTSQPSAAATGAATIAMGSSSFSGTLTVTIKAGQSVTFTSSGTHALVIGMHGQFAAQNGAPSELNTSSGVSFSPGDAKTITFPTSGTFNITCTIHPPMQATVVVMP